MGKKLFSKTVDKSLLKAGLTIPVASCEEVIKVLNAPLMRGEKTDIDIIIDGTIFRAIFTHVDFKASDRDVYQIRYSEGSPICAALKSKYRTPEEAKEEDAYIEVWSTDGFGLEFKCFPNSIKDAFMKYLGPEDSLYGYQKSYKLVFYKCYFSEAFYEEKISVDLLTKQFRQFYIDRKRAGLPVESEPMDEIVSNADKSSVEEFYALILRNPFNAISKKDFFYRQIADGKAYFSINPMLFEALGDDDLNKIRDLTFKKIELYYSKLNKKCQPENPILPPESSGHATNKVLTDTWISPDGATQCSGLKTALGRFMNEYDIESKKPLTGNALAQFIRRELPKEFFKTGLVNKEEHLVVGSAGQGAWAMVPWLCIFDKSITTSAQEGVYIVYLLSKDTKRLYLTFNQGCTNLRKTHSKRETIRLMRQEAERIIKKIDSRGFRTDENINLGEKLTELGELYQKGIIFYKVYEKANLPNEDELRSDLKKMLEIYSDYSHPSEVSINFEAAEPAWLLTWNPHNWNWNDYAAALEASRFGEKYEVTWSCSNTHVKPGDRVYLMILGNNGVRGIIASGVAISKVFEVPHWDQQKAKAGKKTNSVRVSFDKILDFRTDYILGLTTLQDAFPDQKWNPQGSGIEIQPQYAGGLKAMWESFIQRGDPTDFEELIEAIKRYAGGNES